MKSWPPYRMLEDDVEESAKRKLDNLERLYHVGQDKIWDGRTVLSELIAKHGPPRIDPARKEASLRLLSLLLWGELGAWAISADLAERIDDVEAKMAATSQAHDEARHFYVLRDYLRATGEQVPHLGGLARSLLVSILETNSLVEKLIGMQLLVEANALGIFRGLGEAKVDPVLSELLPYYERDEARHVGLGVMYLPRLMQRLSRLELLHVRQFQIRAMATLLTAGNVMRDDMAAIGIDQRRMSHHVLKLQAESIQSMDKLPYDFGDESSWTAMVNFVLPTEGVEKTPFLQRMTLKAWTNVGRLADRVLA